MWCIVCGDCFVCEIYIYEKYKIMLFMVDMCEDMVCVFVEDEFYLWRWKN